MSIDSKKKKLISHLYSNGYSIMMISEKLKIPHNTIRYHLVKNKIPRRDNSEAGYLAHFHRFGKLPFNVKEKLTSEEKKLKIAGTMLYWAEGYKKNNKSTVAFSNSDPKMIRLFLKFLRQICGTQESRLRALLFIFQDQDEVKIKKWWSEFIDIPLKQFHTSFIRKSKSNIGSYKRKSEYGTLLLRYADGKLLRKILSWIDEYVDYQTEPL